MVDEQNRFPVGVNLWELHTTKRKIKYEIKELEINEIFGHEELIELLRWQEQGENGKKPIRRCRIVATQSSEVIYLTLEDFIQGKYAAHMQLLMIHNLNFFFWFALVFGEPQIDDLLQKCFNYNEEDVRKLI